MNTTVSPSAHRPNSRPSHRPASPADDRPRTASPLGRIFGVVGEPQTYRNLAYLLLGLPIGAIWFCVLVTAVAIGVGTIPLALLGIPMLVGCWYLTRALANVERATTAAFLGRHTPHAAMDAPSGNLWQQLRSMSGDRARWREFGYLMLRFPVGIATFTAATALLGTSAAVAYAPFHARMDGDDSFGDWSMSERLHDISSSPWAWLFVPLGLTLAIASLHVTNRLADACADWSVGVLRPSDGRPDAPTTRTLRPEASAERAPSGLSARALLTAHALTFAAVMALLAIIDLADGGSVWLHWPMITWGAVLGFHALVVRTTEDHTLSTTHRVLRVHEAAFGSIMATMFLADLASGGPLWFYWPFVCWGSLLGVHEVVVRRSRETTSS